MPSADLRRPYIVELLLTPEARDGKPTGSYLLTLRDRMVSGVAHSAVVRFDFDAENLDLPSASGLTVGAFLRDFHGDRTVGMAEGLVFGRFLLRRLFPAGEVHELWSGVTALRRAAGMPLRLEVVLPSWDDARLADLPFELLADDQGFLFRRPGHVLVRALRGLRGAACRLAAGERATVVWANPRVRLDGDEPRGLPEEVFTAHEQALAELAPRLGLEALPSCPRAGRQRLRAHLARHAPVAVVSLVVHGEPRGGTLWLHQEDHPDYPADLGEPASGADLARELRQAQAKVALLWSCHGGRFHHVSGAVAQRLLESEGGDLAAVVASHAVLRAEGTARVHLEREFASIRERVREP